MVGVRVGYSNGTRLASIQPIFQVDRSYVEGASQGAPVAGEATVVAKPGYAVGGVNTRTGLLLDAFQLVFIEMMKGRLDPKDSYTSGWLGLIPEAAISRAYPATAKLSRASLD